MTWQLRVARRIDRAGAVVGARVVLEDDATGETRTLEWTRPWELSGAQFRRMLLGQGTLAAPGGEIGAFLQHLNAESDTVEVDL